MDNLNTNQRIYISVVIIASVIVLALLALLFYNNIYKKRNFKKVVGYSLYRYSTLQDYLLLNDYHIHIDENHISDIDHIVITNKFIVIINDFALSGVLSGGYSDNQIKLTTNKGEKMINNPLNYNRNLTKRLALFNDLDNSFLKGIVVVSDDSMIKIDDIPAQFHICRKKELKKLIRSFDEEDIKPFKEDTVVRFINNLNSNNVGAEK